MAKYPFLTARKGSSRLYYKRVVPLELRGEGRPEQIWRSLRTSDRKTAERAYAALHAEIELLFERWRREDGGQPNGAPTPPAGPSVISVLSAPLLRRLADAHYLEVYENDFAWRGALWAKVRADESAFWRGDTIRLPTDDARGRQQSYYAVLMEEPVLEEVFLYAIFHDRRRRLEALGLQYRLGDAASYASVADRLLHNRQIVLSDNDRQRLMRKLMEVEIKAQEDLNAGSEASFDKAIEGQAEAADVHDRRQKKPGELTSESIEKYLQDTARAREWPEKTVLRKRGELREFVEIAGDKPVNAYQQADGVKFKDVQLALPASRNQPPFKGLSLEAAARKAADMRNKGEAVSLLSPITIKDKIGTVSLFFEWARGRDANVVNPLAGQQMESRRSRRHGKKRHPWTIDELNRMFAAPIFTGCRSERNWQEPGNIVLRHSAKYWVPLVALFSGMRLGEIIQMQVADVKSKDGIVYFDVTPLSVETVDDEGDENGKSLKTSSSRRAVPIHKTLLDLGFNEFVTEQRASGATRLFPAFEKAKDDGSWSKQFSKHFKRFRESIGVNRDGVKFHSLRHNVEDALRNAEIRKEVRDAIQGHGENGVSREYGSGYYVKTLDEAVQKIGYEGLFLPRATVRHGGPK